MKKEKDTDSHTASMQPKIIIEETDQTDIGPLTSSLHKVRAAYRNTPSNLARAHVSILIFAYNNLQRHTKYCIESILKYTGDIDYELVLLDNGSSDGTLEYFKTIPHAKKKIVRITENKGANYGQFTATKYLTGRYVAMIANDVYVTPNWLSNMIKCAESDERIGFLATFSDNISNLQAVNLDFTSLDEMRLKAEQYNVSDPRKWEERLRLMPAIALYKRECLDIIGSLDYAFQHDFSDDDISFRIRRAGYKLICCGDVFVHHEGSSAAGTSEKKLEVLKRGRDIFKEKYFGVDAWDDINNFELLMLNLVNPEEMRGKSKPRVLGIDVRCGTPILQLKNKLRLADIFDTELSAFVHDPKYWLDLKTICEGRVVVDRIEFLLEHFPTNSFDYILLGTPLNSYLKSEKVLRDILSLLKTEGQLLIKLSNHFDPKVFLKSAGKDHTSVNNSCISYLDIDHLNHLLMQNGYAVKDIRLALHPLDDATKEAVCAVIKQQTTDDKIEAKFRELTASEYALRILSSRYAQFEAFRNQSPESPKQEENSLAYDTPLSCHFRQASVTSGLTSIIILTHNRLDQTKHSLKSIRKHTTEPHEIILVDNGSTDGTVKWLQGQLKENKNYRLIENKENVGVAKGLNQGIALSQGEFILIMHNDVLVSNGWLSGMLDCMKHAPLAGIVGPMTNNVSGPQQVDYGEYQSVNYLDKYAAKFKEQYHYRRIPCRNLDGFCLLFKRALAEEIGLFDERFGTGQFEDEDFCLRAALKDYQNYIAGDVFIHHGGKGLPGNRNVLDKKWTLSMASPEGKKLTVLKAIELANVFYSKGEIDQAVKALIDCIKLTPDAKEIYYELARIFIESKKFSEAWEVVGTMPENARKDMKGLECAGYAKEGLGQDDEAAAYADMGLSQNENDPAALNLKGILAYKKDDKEKAAAYFRKAIDADPGYGEAYTNLGVLYWSLDKKDEALAHLRKGFFLSPTVPDINSLYYSVISSLGIFSEAEAEFREACSLYPYNKNIAFLYIDILIQQGKFDSAMRNIEDVLDVFGLDEGTLDAALAVREKIGPLQLGKASKKDSLSLCMIVKNEEKHLVKCLKSVRDVVDEMIVVDTGSEDKTIDIARIFGAKIFEFPWTGDFSAARNHSLEQATGDWILILDADEVISERDLNELKALIRKRSSSPAAYSIVTRNYTRNVSVIGWTPNSGQYPEEAGAGWAASAKVRLFKRRKDVRFSNPVHELLEDSLKKANIPIIPCNVVVHHYGKLNMDLDSQKGKDYYLLGKMKYESDPTNVRYINELAKQAHVLGKYEEAIDLWMKLLSLIEADPQSPSYKEISRVSYGEPISEIYIQLASAYLLLNRYEEAIKAARKTIENKVKLKEYVNIYVHCEIIAGSLSNAYSALEELLEANPDYLPALFLKAVIFRLEGKKEKAQELFQLLQQKNVRITSPLNKIARQLLAYDKREETLLILNAAIENKINDEETGTLLKALQERQSRA